MEGVAKPSTSEMKVFEIKVTEIMDVKSFWAQIGTSKFTHSSSIMRPFVKWCERLIGRFSTLLHPPPSLFLAKLLEEFNNQMKEISIWCDANAGCHKSTALLSVEDLVSVKAPEKEGTWIRAKISKIVSEE